MNMERRCHDTKKQYQVCVVTGTRAEYGLLRRTIFKLRACEAVKMHLAVTGSHLNHRFGNTQNEIAEDGINDYHCIELPLDDDSRRGMANAMGTAIIKFAEYFSTMSLDMLVVLGDRFEIFAAVIAAHLLGIPIAHISGGDVTEGAVDDAIRHSITKMSSLHFPGCAASAARIIQMGEHPDTVFNVGEPGVENCLKMELLSRKALAEELKFGGVLTDYAMVTFHPATMEDNTAEAQIYELIQAMDMFPDMSYIITMANADAGGAAINAIWLKESQSRLNWHFCSSLGSLRYLSAVQYARAVIGNSSSGLVEAPVLNTPTVNIGSRQKGRMLADSVISCSPEKMQIAEAMRTVFDEAFRARVSDTASPFGDGTTSTQIADKIVEYLDAENRSKEKQFFDIPFSL